jgi:hypothetical protein
MALQIAPRNKIGVEKRGESAYWPVYRTASTSFQKGAERPLEIKLLPKHIEIRVVGLKEQAYTMPYEAILNQAVEAEVKHRIRRSSL